MKAMLAIRNAIYLTTTDLKCDRPPKN